MTCAEFLEELREALTGKMNASEIESHIAYYNSYIHDEMKKGKTEEEVVDELGSPFAIAKTLLMPYENSENTQETVVRSEEGDDNKSNKILTVVIVILIGLIILSIMFGLLAFVVRYAVPIAVVVLVVRLIKK